jgi:hypothetical protein
MSFVKTSVTLAIGAVLGVALKYAKDFNDGRKTVTHHSARYRAMLEASLPGLRVDADLDGGDAAKIWEQGVSSIVFGQFFGEADATRYPIWVKDRIGEELEALYHEFKVYKPA